MAHYACHWSVLRCQNVADFAADLYIRIREPLGEVEEVGLKMEGADVEDGGDVHKSRIDSAMVVAQRNIVHAGKDTMDTNCYAYHSC